jgi:hypothetical protein
MPALEGRFGAEVRSAAVRSLKTEGSTDWRRTARTMNEPGNVAREASQIRTLRKVLMEKDLESLPSELP